MRPALIVRRAADYLSRHHVQSPLPTAEILLAKVLGTDRAGLYTQVEGLSTAEAKRFGRVLCQRCVGVPLQHLTGEQGFRRLTLVVRPGVFIPRPETEILVERALAVVADVPAPVVVDVGTGTGAVALAIKDERPDARVLAIDLSLDAVALARDNAVRSSLDVEVVAGDLLDTVPVALRGAVDLVVSNPPYVEEDELAALPREVRADPILALVGGVGVFERLFAQAREVLRPGAAVAVEIGETQGADIRAAASRAGFVAVEVEPDLTGRDRVVTARMPA
ncbi:MAG: peptide chain release factor N(5)-glutamine methyltransferase [Actinomycetota bacterium]